jgi:alkylation response protein AidB-like acyl-CoA dehydrogenase
MVRDLCRNFAKNEVMPIAEELDKTGQFPYDVWKKMGDLGICGIPFPQECEGWGLDWVSMIIANEEINRGDAFLGNSLLGTVTLAMNLLCTFGTEDQRKKWLIPLAIRSLATGARLNSRRFWKGPQKFRGSTSQKRC